MSKLFGEYLVEKEILTKDDLIELLIAQSKGLPSVSEIVFQSKLLDSEKILQAFKFQNQKRVEFTQACKELGFWTDEISETVELTIIKQRRLLGQLLIEKGLLSSAALVEVLEEYMESQAETNKKNSEEDSEIKSEKISKEAIKVESKIVSNADSKYKPNSKPLPEKIIFEPLDDVAVSEFLLFFDEFYFESMQKRNSRYQELEFETSESSESLIHDVAREITDTVRSIRGRAHFAKLQITEHMLLALENLFCLLSEKTPISPSSALSAIKSYTEACEVLWKMRISILKFKSEENYTASKEYKTQYIPIFEQLSKLMEDIGANNT